MAFIRRASLDAFWAREPSTVMANLREAIRMEKFTSSLGLPSVTPPMGPFPLRDDFGMLPAIALLDRSLAKGIHSEYVQWGTFRKAMSAGGDERVPSRSGWSWGLCRCIRKKPYMDLKCVNTPVLVQPIHAWSP